MFVYATHKRKDFWNGWTMSKFQVLMGFTNLLAITVGTVTATNEIDLKYKIVASISAFFILLVSLMRVLIALTFKQALKIEQNIGKF